MENSPIKVTDNSGNCQNSVHVVHWFDEKCRQSPFGVKNAKLFLIVTAEPEHH